VHRCVLHLLLPSVSVFRAHARLEQHLQLVQFSIWHRLRGTDVVLLLCLMLPHRSTWDLPTLLTCYCIDGYSRCSQTRIARSNMQAALKTSVQLDVAAAY